MHIVVMGSGGVGGYFGAQLHRAGERVTLVARGAHLQALKRSGLTLRSAVEGNTVVERLEGVDRADAVLFCVKSFDTEDAAARLWSILGPDTAVLSPQNGVDNEDKIDAMLGAAARWAASPSWSRSRTSNRSASVGGLAYKVELTEVAATPAPWSPLRQP